MPYGRNRIAPYLMSTEFIIGATVDSPPPSVPTGNVLPVPIVARPAEGQRVRVVISIRNNSTFAVTVGNLIANIVNPATGLVAGFFLTPVPAFPFAINPGATQQVTMTTGPVQARQTLDGDPDTLDVVYELVVEGQTFVFANLGFMITPVGVVNVTITDTQFTAIS